MNNNLPSVRIKRESKGYGGQQHRPSGGHNISSKAITVITQLEYSKSYIGKISPFGFGCKEFDNCFNCKYPDCVRPEID